MSSKLGFSVNDLLPRARGGGTLKMGLVSLTEGEWLQAEPDVAIRAKAFDAYPGGVQLTDAVQPAGEELAAMLGVTGGLEGAARSRWEDMCLLTPLPGEDVYRLIGAAVAFPTDWLPAKKLGLPLTAMHAPIHGYEAQLATGVDRFMASLKAGRIFGRCNWFVAPTPSLRWIDTQPPSTTFAKVTPENAGECLFVRCERQTLRRLPETDAILFTIGVHISPLADLTPDNLQGLADALATIPQAEATRRGARYYAAQLQAFAAAKVRQ